MAKRLMMLAVAVAAASLFAATETIIGDDNRNNDQLTDPPSLADRLLSIANIADDRVDLSAVA